MRLLADLAGNLDISTAQVLTALRIVSTRAGIDEVTDWTKKELEGYSESDELPPHRIWRLTIKATLYNPNQAIMNDVNLGDCAIDENIRENATIYRCRDGVWQIEDMLRERGDRRIGAEHPNLATLINQGPMLGEGWTCTHANAEFSPIHMKEIVNKARQVALELCLECEKSGVDLLWSGDDGNSLEGRNKWLETIKNESTKEIIRRAFAMISKTITELCQ